MAKKQNSKITWGSAKESKQIIINAALDCFERYGPQRTSMDDIAAAAGISRKTLYRVFEDRPTLIQAVLQWRWIETAKLTQQRIAAAADFTEALLEGSITAVSAVHQDKLARDIIEKSTDKTLEQFLILGNERSHKAMRDIWQDAIDQGRQAGLVKQNLTDEQIFEIIMSIHALLIMRDEGPDQQRAFLQDVLIPSITIPRQG